MPSLMPDVPVKRIAGPVAVGLLVFVLLLIVGALVGSWWLQVSKKEPLSPELRGRGRLAVIGDTRLAGTDAQGTTTLQVSALGAVHKALKKADESQLNQALRRDRVSGLLVGPLRYSAVRVQDPLSLKLLNYAALDDFRAEFLSERAALYLPYRRPAITPVMGKALAHLARKLLSGSRPPALQSLPTELTQPDDVEVMVLIRNQLEPQLWRSARSSSVARALLTACQVAKDRWAERAQAMGGPLPSLLESLSVEVWLLTKDGTLTDRTDVFVNHVFKPEHGVAYEHKAAWRYMLPEFVRKVGRGSAVEAYMQLFRTGGEPEASLQRRDIRLYRLRATLLGTSLPPGPGG